MKMLQGKVWAFFIEHDYNTSLFLKKVSRADPGENLTIAQIDMCRRRTLGGVLYMYFLDETAYKKLNSQNAKSEETLVLGRFNFKYLEGT